MYLFNKRVCFAKHIYNNDKFLFILNVDLDVLDSRPNKTLSPTNFEEVFFAGVQ